MDLTRKQRAIALYQPPFKPMYGYIHDALGNVVADDNTDNGEILQIRGWGRISYMPEPEQLQDDVGELVAEALNQFWINNGGEAYLETKESVDKFDLVKGDLVHASKGKWIRSRDYADACRKLGLADQLLEKKDEEITKLREMLHTLGE